MLLFSLHWTHLVPEEHILQCHIRKSTKKILCRRVVTEMDGVFVRLSKTEILSERLHLSKSFKESERKHTNYKIIGAASNSFNSNADILLEENFQMDPLGSVSMILSPDYLAWQPFENVQDMEMICCWRFLDNKEKSNRLELSEIYGVKLGNMEHTHQDKSTAGIYEPYHFTVYTYKKYPKPKETWIPRSFTFYHTNKGICESWANRLQSLIDRVLKRPKNLLVIINPHSGKKTGSKTWKQVSSLFEQANINTKVLETTRVRHAFDVMDRASDDELSKLDGVVIVGGDGLFNEVLNGLLLRRHRARYPPKPQTDDAKEKSVDVSRCDIARTEVSSLTDGESSNYISLSASEVTDMETVHTVKSVLRCNEYSSTLNDESIYYKDGGFVVQSVCALDGRGEATRGKECPSNSAFVFPNEAFRIGIIPSGSTDSIAISWKSRSTSTEELPRIRYAASFAGYGFYGDVIKESEPSRWMGPMRYDYAGTKVFAQHKLYKAKVSFIEIPERNRNTSSFNDSQERSSSNLNRTKETSGEMVCGRNCSICANGFDFSEMDERSLLSMYPSEKGSRWKHSNGYFISIGAAVISCRNEKAPNGVVANAHLADGLIHLILIKDCSRFSYLWHLIQLTKKDGHPLDFEFIEVYKTPYFNFTSLGEESVWNVDGELFPAHQLSAQVFRGLVNIFASGPII